jgi:hypothetical protein
VAVVIDTLLPDECLTVVRELLEPRVNSLYGVLKKHYWKVKGLRLGLKLDQLAKDYQTKLAELTYCQVQ